MKNLLIMKKNTFLITIALLISAITAMSQTAVAPTNGDGTENNPYEITNLENLYWLSLSDTLWDKNFIQTADIDAFATSAWDTTKGFNPIGRNGIYFTGKYNGKGHVIHRLTIDRSANCIGFFGATNSATIDSLGLTNVDFAGDNYIGGLIGIAYWYTSINNCFSSGSVRGDSYIGGLVGGNYNNSEISLSYSTCNVSSSYSTDSKHYIGGFVGHNNAYSIINECYCTGNVIGCTCVGGFVGKNNDYSEVNNCYSSGNTNAVSGGTQVGGFIGKNTTNSIVTNSYTSGNEIFVYDGMLDNISGGFVGNNAATINNSFFDYSVTECTDAHGVNSKSTAEMQEMCLYVDGTLASWDFIGEDINGTDDIWGININENGGYPFLKFQNFTHTGSCCSFNDTETPTFTSNNLEINLNSNGSNTINSSDILTNVQDNCTIESTVISQTTFTCNDIGINDIYITVTDMSGNETKDTVQVTVIDNTAPILTYQNVVYIDQTGNGVLDYTITDNCEVVDTIISQTNFTCSDIGNTFNFDITASDASGNTTSETITISVEDIIAPTIPVLIDVTGECSASITETPTTSDNCAGTITGTTTDDLTYNTQGTHTVTWTFDDGNGNNINVNQNVIINDITTPTISCPENQIVTVNQYNIYPVNGNEFDPIASSDNCEIASIENNYNNSTTLSGEMLDEGMHQITWTITDINNNETTCTFLITASGFTELEEQEDVSIKIYPNPTKGVINIKFAKNNIEKIIVSDISGKQIIEKLLVQQDEIIDLQKFEKGIYILSIITDKEIIIKKIIKE